MQPVNQTGAAALLEALVGGPKPGQDGTVAGSVFAAFFDGSTAPGLQVAAEKAPAAPSGAAVGFNAIMLGAAPAVVEENSVQAQSLESADADPIATASLALIATETGDAGEGLISIDPEHAEAAALAETASVIGEGELDIGFETAAELSSGAAEGESTDEPGSIVTAFAGDESSIEAVVDNESAGTAISPMVLTSASGEAVSAAAKAADKGIPGAVADAVVPLTPAGTHNPHYFSGQSTDSASPANVEAAVPAPATTDASIKPAEGRASANIQSGAPTTATAAEGDSPDFSGNSDQGQRQSAATLFQPAKGSAPSGGNQPPSGDIPAFEPASAPAGRPVFDPGATLPAIARGLEAVTMETGTAVRAGAAAQVFVPAARLTETLGLRISRAVADGESKFTLRIDPPELGRIEVRLEFTADNRLRATMVAENREALNILQRDAAHLERALSDAGVKADSGSLNFSLKEQGDGHGTHAFTEIDEGDDPLIAGDGDIELSAAAAEAIAQRAVSHRLVDMSI